MKLRQLIQECKTFLHAQPRNQVCWSQFESRHREVQCAFQFEDLQVTTKMMSYMCDIRAKTRTQDELAHHLATEIAAQESENQTLREKLTKLEAERRDEREESLNVERNLRRYCEETQRAYTTLAK